MKDTLNAKVKFREWYRPFAPMVRYEDRNKYFVFTGDSPYMSFACPVRETYREDLPAITHVDGTARLQTVKESDNPFIYELLNEIERKGSIPILLNTSFNIKGLPILTSVEHALAILKKTELDNVVIEGNLF
jgi:carbamoyltransferase